VAQSTPAIEHRPASRHGRAEKARPCSLTSSLSNIVDESTKKHVENIRRFAKWCVFQSRQAIAIPWQRCEFLSSRETKHPLERASRRFDPLKTADVKVEQAQVTCCLLLNIARAF
jgi:hypothetical protein